MNTNNHISTGAVIRAIRGLHKLSQIKLAHLSMIYQTDISKIENDELLPTEAQRKALETALCIRFDDPRLAEVFSESLLEFGTRRSTIVSSITALNTSSAKTEFAEVA